jgi:hypothetical protein
MTITPEQRTYARLAGIMFLAKVALEGFGDSVTIIARSGQSFADTARFAAEHMLLWRFCLLNVGLAWIVLGILSFVLFVVLEPVNKRLAQLALVLRLGACFVGAPSLMFRLAQARLFQASATEGLFTAEQLRTLAAVSQQGANAGVWIAWMFLGAAVPAIALPAARACGLGHLHIGDGGRHGRRNVCISSAHQRVETVLGALASHRGRDGALVADQRPPASDGRGEGLAECRVVGRHQPR